MSDYVDFSDYGKPFGFKYDGVKYQIPQFNKAQLEGLMEINKTLVSVQSELQSKVDPQSDGDVPSEKDILEDGIDDNTSKYLDIQDEFLAFAVRVEDAADPEKFIKKDKEYFKDWPLRLKTKVMSTITDQMNIADEGDAASEKKL